MTKTYVTNDTSKSKGVKAIMKTLRSGQFLTRTQLERKMFSANNRGNDVNDEPISGYGRSYLHLLEKHQYISRTKVPCGKRYTYVYTPGPKFNNWWS